MKSGYHNHYLLEGSEFLCKGSIKGTLYNFGLPGYKRAGDYTVHGQLYRVNDATLARLDRLEGYYEQTPEKSLYNRVSTTVTAVEGQWSAYVYEINYDTDNVEVIPTGEY